MKSDTVQRQVAKHLVHSRGQVLATANQDHHLLLLLEADPFLVLVLYPFILAPVVFLGQSQE